MIAIQFENKTTFLILLLLAIFLPSSNILANEKKMQTNQALSAEEKSIIIDKGTERPFSGQFWNHKENGIYNCRQCGSALYLSKDKFESNCGWPSFDDAISGAVTRKPDADGRRTEIICTKCDAHLGHVFIGEQLTDKNTRHCVNSISMKFTAAESVEVAIFAGGCFWGIENAFSKIDGVLDVMSGYTGGTTKKPSYEEVSTEKTGHAEAVQIIFDNTKVNFESLARLFFELHDPTQLNRQGVDIGSQYRSALFYTTDEQKVITDKLIKLLIENNWQVQTQVEKAKEFYPAENYHQDFTERTGRGACHTKVARFEQKNNF